MSRAGYMYTADEFYCDVPDCQNRASANSDCPRGWLVVDGETEAAGQSDQTLRHFKSSPELHLCTQCKKRSRYELREVGFLLFGGRHAWEVRRASTTFGPLELVFRGDEGTARKKFEKVASYMRRGEVILLRPEGVLEDRK